MSVSRTSRNNYAAVIRIVNAAGELVEREHLDLRPSIVTTRLPDNSEVTPAPSDNWSRISWRMLGDGQFWWIIADWSKVVDPFQDLRPSLKTKYLAQLGADIPSGGPVASIQVTRLRDFQRGQKIRIENLDPSNLQSVDTSVIGINGNTSSVVITPIVLSTNLPAAMSRVSHLISQSAVLTVPSIHTALFNALDFGNSLNTLVP